MRRSSQRNQGTSKQDKSAPTTQRNSNGDSSISVDRDYQHVSVQLKLSKEHTADGTGREVEFIFIPASDNLQVSFYKII